MQPRLDDEREQQLVARMLAMVGRCQRLVADLSDVTHTRAAGGSIAIKRRRVDLDATLAAVLDEQRRTHPESGARSGAGARVDCGRLGCRPIGASAVEPRRQCVALQPSSNAAHGLGLGLYLVEQIALAHGGSVEVASTEAEGTRFAVILPLGAARS